MSDRRRRDRRPLKGGGESRTYRFLFSVMGPPQLGRPDEPPAPPTPPDRSMCRGCGRLWSEHPIVRDAFSPYTLCPGQPIPDLTRANSA